MADTLDRLLDHYGPGSKAVVWAHNTHVGDARATTMVHTGMVNIGELGRERYGADQVVLVGFGCHHGEVVAAPAWGAPMEVMRVPPARRGSLETALHDGAPARAVFVFPGCWWSSSSYLPQQQQYGEGEGRRERDDNHAPA